MNEKEKNRQEIIKYAVGELKKASEDIKSGKAPSVSPHLRKIFKTLSEAETLLSEKKISEEDMDNVVKEIVKQITKKDE